MPYWIRFAFFPLLLLTSFAASVSAQQTPPRQNRTNPAWPPVLTRTTPLPEGRGLLGSTVAWQYYAYGSAYFLGSGMFKVNGGIGGTFNSYFNILADATSITFAYSVVPNQSGTWSPSVLSLPPTIHNGIAINMVSGPGFATVTIDPATNMVGFDASRISFTADQIQVDWQNLFFNDSTIVKLDVNAPQVRVP